MSERESATPQDDPNALRGDLFENLPDPDIQIPTVDSTPPAPGSRRALREAARQENSPLSGGPTESPVAEAASIPVSPTGPEPSDRPAGGGLEDLFQSPDEPHETDKPRRRRRGCLVALIIVLVLVGGLAAGGTWVWTTYGDKISDALGWGEPKDWDAGVATGEVFVTVNTGDTGRPISTALFEAGVTRTDKVFYDYLIAEGLNPNFYPGVYKLQEKMTAADALAALEDPENKVENSVGIQEGGTIESSLPRIEEAIGIPLADLQAAVKDPSVYGVQAESLEGWLFPAVYQFDPGATATDIIKRMVDRTREALADAGVPDADAQRVLTIASILQREARTPDFAKVSRVIQNRLDDGMKLQMDSTAQFGFGELHAGSASTSKEAQNDPNPWNTYYVPALPAGPIANPSQAAINAALNPADGTWLYFVTINMATGDTQFSDTYAEHLQGVKKMQAWCRENPNTGC